MYDFHTEPDPRDPKPVEWQRAPRMAFRVLLVLGMMAALAFSALIVMAAEAGAHSWFTTTKDPETKLGCCGGQDCAEIDETAVRAVPGGYVYIPTGEFIPRSRIQPSQSYRFARCEYLSTFEYMGKTMRKGDTRCFFEPSGF